MLAGLVRGRAELRKLLSSPVIAAPLDGAVAGRRWRWRLRCCRGSARRRAASLQLRARRRQSAPRSATSGGRVLAEDRSESSAHQRGAIVSRTIGAPPARTRPQRESRHEITLAGRAVPAADETKHFKLIGTTGTGKSTAIQEILDAALARGDRAVIADPDGGYLHRFYDPAPRRRGAQSLR